MKGTSSYSWMYQLGETHDQDSQLLSTVSRALQDTELRDTELPSSRTKREPRHTAG